MGPQKLQVSKSRFTSRVDLWWWWLLMTGFWVHLNAQLTDPREPTAHAGKTPPPGRLAGAGAEIRALLKPTQCGGSTQRATQTDQDTNKYGEGGWDIRAPYLLPLLSMDIDEERFVLLWLAL